SEAPPLRKRIADAEAFINEGSAAKNGVLRQFEKDLAALKAEQTYLATQISLLEESIESLGFDPATGKPKPPAPKKPANDDPRTPTFDFIGTWSVNDVNGQKIGTLTVGHADSPGIIDCNGADGNQASGPGAARFIGGRLEFEKSNVAWNRIRVGGHVRWLPLVDGGPPRPGVFLGCVTAAAAEIWLHPETGNVPDLRLKIRGDSEDKKSARGDVSVGGRSPDANYRWWYLKKE
ncbi:MAG: hypothetical protein ABIR80_06510, partial [Opitutaceae bacterium]